MVEPAATDWTTTGVVSAVVGAVASSPQWLPKLIRAFSTEKQLKRKADLKDRKDQFDFMQEQDEYYAKKQKELLDEITAQLVGTRKELQASQQAATVKIDQLLEENVECKVTQATLTAENKAMKSELDTKGKEITDLRSRVAALERQDIRG